MAVCHPGSCFDLRPGVMTQLCVLSRLYKCYWLTCWPWNEKGTKHRVDITTLMRNLYGTRINQDFQYREWCSGDPQRKAGAVLAKGAPENFYWLEDPLSPEEIAALKEAGKLDRYIRVEPKGQWGFLDAVNELFRRTGVTDNDLKRVGAKPEWFRKECILADNSAEHHLNRVLNFLQFLVKMSQDDTETLGDIREFLEREQLLRKS
jgi:hypothetical protein